MNPVAQDTGYSIFASEDPHVQILRFDNNPLDPASTGRPSIAELNNRIAAMAFRYLEQQYVASVYLDIINTHEMRVRRVTRLPLIVRVHGSVTASLALRLGLPEGTRLQSPIVEYYYKNEALGDPLFNEDHIRVMEVATRRELEEIRRLALLSFEAMQAFWFQAKIQLMSFSVEFGTSVDGTLLLSQALTPDTQTLWPLALQSDGMLVAQRGFSSALAAYSEAYDALVSAWPAWKLNELLPPSISG